MSEAISIGAFVTARPVPYQSMNPVIQGIYIDGNPDGTINVLTQLSGAIVCDRDARNVADKELFGDRLAWVKAWRDENLKSDTGEMTL